MVADLLAAGDQLFVVGGGRVEAAALGVAEALDRLLCQGVRLGVPAGLESRLVERQQRLEQEGVVLQVGAEVGASVLVGAQQAAFGLAQLLEDELGAGASRVKVVLT